MSAPRISAACRGSTPASASATRSTSSQRLPVVPMRDEQVRRYARHLMLPDVGGLGQTALMVASAKLLLRESEPDAELVAGRYLAAGGVGVLVVASGSDEQRADIAARGADTKVQA